MSKDLKDVEDFELVTLTAEGLSMDEIAVRLGGMSRELVRQRLANLSEYNAMDLKALRSEMADHLRQMTAREILAELAEVVQVGDSLMFFNILEAGHAAVRWINPLALTGKVGLETLQAELEAEAKAVEKDERPVNTRTVIILPTAPEPWLTRELLRSLISKATESVVVIASRTVLRKTLFDFD